MIHRHVRMIGIEPTWVAPPDPKSGASASFATSAKERKQKRLIFCWLAKVIIVGICSKFQENFLPYCKFVVWIL
jgi:hypothetical protein